MDIFMEKIVRRQKDIKDHLLTAAIIIAAFILMFLVLNFIPPQLSIFFIVGIIYISYMVITTRNIEYEYAVTNGDLDIDKIVAQRKRKRIFSANCKTFEIVAKVKSSHYTPQYKNFKNQINCTSSPSLNSDDIYFVALQYNNEQTIVYFEPTEKMLNSFKTFIPRKVFVE